MTRAAALRIIRACAAGEMPITFVRHARRRRAERRIDHGPIMSVLRMGQIVEGPYMDQHGCWRCTLRRFLAGEELTVVIAICDDELVVITAY